MKRLKNVALYPHRRAVKEGDEFFQVTLSESSRDGKVAYLVETFHGRAGALPKLPKQLKPACSQEVESEMAAVQAFEGSIQEIEERGFLLYNSAIHGRDREFEGLADC